MKNLFRTLSILQIVIIAVTAFLCLNLTGCGSGGGGPISEAYAGNTSLGSTWIDESGRVNQQSFMDNGSTAYTMWPTRGLLPIFDSYAELTLYRTDYRDMPNYERFNVSAMASSDGSEPSASYRFGVERGGTGKFHDIIFCYENVTPGVAVCPMKVTLGGVFVSVNGEWHSVAYN